MVDLITWLITHQVTLAGLAIAFLLGSIWGMWIQFSEDDKEKSPQRAGTREDLKRVN